MLFLALGNHNDGHQTGPPLFRQGFEASKTGHILDREYDVKTLLSYLLNSISTAIYGRRRSHVP